ncbi:MAG: DNA-binding protein [Ignavibacteriales bacterium]|nr:MAG: DNA-binding protein [Ignavibacteriales bacterium]
MKSNNKSRRDVRRPHIGGTPEILKRIDELENLLKKNPDHAYRQTSKPMTFKETCAYLSYAPSYLYKLTYKKIIPHHKPTGKMLYFFKNEIDEWIAKNGRSER